MANRFDEVIRLVLETQGTGDITRLATAVAELEKDFQHATPEVRGLLDELRRISDAKTAVNELQSLDTQLERNALQLREAKDGLQALNEEFKRSDKTSTDVKTAFAQAEKAVRDLANEQVKLERSSASLRDNLKRAGVDAKDLAAAEKQLGDESGKVATKIHAASDAIKASRTESDRAAEAIVANNRRTSQSFNSTTQDVGLFRKALGAIGVAFSLDALKNGIIAILGVGDAAERTKIQLTQLYGDQAAGNKAFNDIRALAKELGVSFDATREAAVRLKAVGLEPLDGTLRSLINANALVGGSQETLLGIITQLGQGYAKQKLQTEDLLSIAERGIPIFDLLAKVTGKQGAELNKLIESGKIGRVEIKALIDELGRSADGAAAKSIGTLGSLVTQLKDQFTAFLERIANSGAADFFKEKLKAIRNEIELMVTDGRLQKFAEDTSNSITSIGTAVSAVAEKWRILSGASAAATGAIQTTFFGTVKALSAASAGVTGLFARLTGAGEVTAATFDRLNTSAGEKLSAALKKTGQGAADVGAGFGLASDKGQKLVGTFADVQAGATSTADVFANVTAGVESTAPAYDALAVAAAKAAEEIGKAQDAVTKAEANLQKARDAVVALSNANETSNEKWKEAEANIKAASGEVEAARKKVADLTGETAKAEAATKALSEAFGTLKVTSQADLDAAAAAAKTAFETIVQASYQGKAAAADVTRAFAAFAAAERARVAEGDDQAKREVERLIRIAASAAGLSAEYEKLGQAGKKAGEDTAQGLDAAAAKIDAAADSAAKLGDAAQTAAEDLGTIADSATTVTVAVNDAGVGLGYMSDQAREALAAAQGFDGIDQVLTAYKNEIFATREELDAFTASQKAAADAASSAADEIAKLTDKLREQRDAATLSAADLEQKRYETELAHIQELADAAGVSNRAQAAELRGLAEAEHQRKLDEIAQEARARSDSNHSGASSGSGGGGQSSGGGIPTTRQTTNQTSNTNAGVTYAPTINFGGIDLTSPSDRRRLVDLLSRDLEKAIKDIGRRAA